MRSIFFSSLLISLALLLGRVSGFIRELFLAAKYGISEQADIAVFLLTLPDFLVAFLLAGGFNAAFIPAMKRHSQKGQAALFVKVSLTAGFIFGLLAIALSIVPALPFQVLAPSLSESAIARHTSILQLSLLALPLAALSGICAGYLNVTGKFFLPGISTLIFNTIIIAFLIITLGGIYGLKGLVFAIILAAFLRFLALLLPLLKNLKQLDIGAAHLNTKLLSTFLVGVLGFGLIAAVPIMFRTLYAAEGAGNLALYNYAQKLFELPAVLLLAPIMTVVLPKLSGLSNDAHQFRNIATLAIKAAISVASIAVVIGLIFGEHIARLIFLHGSMTEEAVQGIASLAQILFLALPLVALFQISSAGLNALGHTRRVFVNAILSLIITLLILWLVSQTKLNAALVLPAGFVLFYLIIATLNLHALHKLISLNRKNLSRDIFRSLSISAFCAAPFVILMRFLPQAHPQFWLVLLTFSCGSVMLFAHRQAFKPLLKIKSA